jgi:hypothetical protein
MVKKVFNQKKSTVNIFEFGRKIFLAASTECSAGSNDHFVARNRTITQPCNTTITQPLTQQSHNLVTQQ